MVEILFFLIFCSFGGTLQRLRDQQHSKALQNWLFL